MSDVISKGKNALMDVGGEVMGVGKSVASKETIKETFTMSNMTKIVYVAGGMAFGTLVSGAIIKYIPFSRMGTVGRGLRGLTTMTVGSGILMYGQKNKQNNYGLAFTVGGGTMAVVGFLDLVGITGMFNGVANVVRGAEETLSGYQAIDSVEVDKTSYQPTQDYGAEGRTDEEIATADTPQVSIASRMESDPMDSVREEAAMGHGVTQWFGSEHSSSASPLFRKAPSMRAFKASTDVGGNRTTTGDNSMANVIGGASMADSPATTSTAYDVSMETSLTPSHTKEIGGIQDAFDTYILPSYAMPSAGDSGRGVTEWYAESNQTGFIGNFMAGAEGHGSVLGQ